MSEDAAGPKRSLVFGAGNRLKTDDGAGILVLEYLREHDPGLGTIADLEDGGLAGADVLPLFAGRDRIVIIDALLSGGEPGSVVAYVPDRSTPWPSRYSLHQTGPLEALAQLALAGQSPDVRVVGIVAEDVDSPGMEPTPRVGAAIPAAARAVRDALMAAPTERGSAT
jgi:hydrogenase maturation protease